MIKHAEDCVWHVIYILSGIRNNNIDRINFICNQMFFEEVFFKINMHKGITRMKHHKGQMFFVNGEKSFSHFVAIYNHSKENWITFYSFFYMNSYVSYMLQTFDLSLEKPLR